MSHKVPGDGGWWWSRESFQHGSSREGYARATSALLPRSSPREFYLREPESARAYVSSIVGTVPRRLLKSSRSHDPLEAPRQSAASSLRCRDKTKSRKGGRVGKKSVGIGVADVQRILPRKRHRSSREERGEGWIWPNVFPGGSGG